MKGRNEAWRAQKRTTAWQLESSVANPALSDREYYSLCTWESERRNAAIGLHAGMSRPQSLRSLTSRDRLGKLGGHQQQCLRCGSSLRCATRGHAVRVPLRSRLGAWAFRYN